MAHLMDRCTADPRSANGREEQRIYLRGLVHIYLQEPIAVPILHLSVFTLIYNQPPLKRRVSDQEVSLALARRGNVQSPDYIEA